MKLVTAILLIAILAAGSALAEKAPDVKDAVFNSPILMTESGTLDDTSPTYDRAFNNGLPAATSCDYGLNDSGNDGQSYAAYCLSVTNTDPIEVVIDEAGTSLGDTFIAIYCDTFDPAFPLENAIFTDDDDGPGLLSAITLADNVVLNPAWNYTLIITTFSAGDLGDFTFVTTDNVLGCPVAAENSTWGTLKSLYR